MSTRLDLARTDAEQADAAVADAEMALDAAQRGPKESERLAADAAVDAAQRNLDEAVAAGVAGDIADAQGQLAVARAQRRELLAGTDTSLESAAATQARARQAQTSAELLEATIAAAAPLPAAEVVFVSSLPRRVDVVGVARGNVLDGPAMVVSGATVVVRSNIGPTDRALLAEGTAAEVGIGDEVIGAAVASIVDDATTGSATVTFELVDPTDAQLEVIRGQNVKVTIPIAATDGEVLAVPLAALTSGPSGESRIERRRPDGATELITVTVGLAADGYAEVSAPTATIAEGDLVVIGR